MNVVSVCGEHKVTVSSGCSLRYLRCTSAPRSLLSGNVIRRTGGSAGRTQA